MKLLSLPEMSLYGAVLIAAVLLLRAVFLNRLPKRTFSSLWGLAILRLLLPFSVASAVSLYALLPAPESLPAAPTPEPAPIVTTAEPAKPAVTVPPAQFSTPIMIPENVSPTVTEPITAAEPNADVSPETVLPLIWCSGAALLLLVFAAVYLRGRREFQMSLPIRNDFIEAWQKNCPLRRKVTVRRSDRISAPLTYGVLRPVILLPDPIGTDEKTLGHILTHELVHIRRFDAVKKPLCALAVCLHWFNPLVWIMFFYFTRDLELACDEGAVLRLGIGDRSDYARTLIGMEARKSGFLPFFSHFAGFAAEERIKAIMKLKKSSVITSIAAALLVCGTAGVFLTSAAAKPEEEAALTDREKTVKEMEAYQKEIDEIIAEAPKTETAASADEQKDQKQSAEDYENRINALDGVKSDLLAEQQELAERQSNLDEEIRYTAARLAEFQAALEELRNGSPDPAEEQRLDAECEQLKKERDDLLAERQDAAERRQTLAEQLEQIEAVIAEFQAAIEKTAEWQWWTAEEYEKWIEEQEKEMESLIGTGSGWYDKEGKLHTFTRESMNEILAEYRATLEEIKKGVKVSKPDDDGAVLMQTLPKDAEQTLTEAEKIENAVEAVEITQTDLAEAYVETPEQEKARIDGLFAEYERFGLTRDENGKVYFHGKPVRIFFDGVDHLADVAMITRYSYLDEEGEIDVRTLWTPKDNGDGSVDPFGIMIGIEETTSLNINDFRPALEAVTAAEGNSAEGTTIPDRLRFYERFGITYNESENNIYFNGKLVGTFVDSPGDGIFTFASQNVKDRETIDVRTVYENGKIVSVRELTDAEKNGILWEQPATSSPFYLKEMDSPDISETLAKQPASPLKTQYLSNLETYEGLGNALRFLAPNGEEVYSVADGTVVFSQWEMGFGRTVIVRSADGNCWGYGHLNKDLSMASLGETVKAGDVIGYVGTTGWTVESVLHLFLADRALFENSAALLTESPIREVSFISEEFGRISETLFHNGIDFSAKEGTDICAFADGTVLEAGYDASNGNYLLIDHGNGLQSFYAHCSVRYAKAGDTVQKGAVIAAVGNSGWSTGPHLHFELRKDGTPIDPKPYLNETNETTANP